MNARIPAFRFEGWKAEPKGNAAFHKNVHVLLLIPRYAMVTGRRAVGQRVAQNCAGLLWQDPNLRDKSLRLFVFASRLSL